MRELLWRSGVEHKSSDTVLEQKNAHTYLDTLEKLVSKDWRSTAISNVKMATQGFKVKIKEAWKPPDDHNNIQ